jgi:hypothetical protein
MAAVIPVGKVLYLCDDILSDPARGKPHLVGILNAIRPPALPHAIPKLCVFARLVGGHGDVRCRVRVVSARDLSVVYESADQPVRFADPLQTRYFVLRLTDVTIHTPGVYWLELSCDGQFLDDAILRIVG